jgi:hypothetical protein
MNDQSRRKFLKRTAIASSLFMLPSISSVMANEMFQNFDQKEADELLKMGLLDVTKSPFNADPSGKIDSTKALQDALNESRNRQLVCFFPLGTYLISDTLSCEQRVEKRSEPAYYDNQRQTYWDKSSDRFYIMGSTKDGKRPVIKLFAEAKGFDNPDKPKVAMKIWAQTRNDFPGKDEPKWGWEEPGISFNHILRGIDFDISGHPGAIGLRHSGSQGCLLMESKVYAEGAFAGFNNTPGQGGGTYNIEVQGGRYGLYADPHIRYPMLASCIFKGQTVAPVFYKSSSSPMVLVGCVLESNGNAVIDLTQTVQFAGISMIDCIITLNRGGSIVSHTSQQNIFMENVFVKGAQNVQIDGDKIIKPSKWTEITRYSFCSGSSKNLVNGLVSNRTFVDWKSDAAKPNEIDYYGKHWRKLPSFEDVDAINILALGAVGDGETDNSAVFKKAIASGNKIFIPNGRFKVNEPIQLVPSTQLFGIKGSSVIAPAVITHDGADDNTYISFLTLSGNIEWNSGKGAYAFSNAQIKFGKNGGGRFYATRSIGGRGSGRLLENTTQPIAMYALNVERVPINPQSYIKNCKNVSIFYLKSEASPNGFFEVNGPNSANTSLSIIDSNNIKIYCVNGNILTTGNKPVIEVVNSRNVAISQIKTNWPADFPQIREKLEDIIVEVPSERIVALYIRD